MTRGFAFYFHTRNNDTSSVAYDQADEQRLWKCVRFETRR